MKEEITKLFKETIDDTPFPLPLKYYGKVQSLAGMVYDKEKDSHMDDELKELSNYVQFLSNLDELKGHIKQIMPNNRDYTHMFNTGLDYRQQNLTQATINFPQTINFPELNQEVSERIINATLDKFENIRSYEFSVPRIIAWAKTKIQLDNISEH